MKRKEKSSAVVSVRMPPTLKRALEEWAQERDTTPSRELMKATKKIVKSK